MRQGSACRFAHTLHTLGHHLAGCSSTSLCQTETLGHGWGCLLCLCCANSSPSTALLGKSAFLFLTMYRSSQSWSLACSALCCEAGAWVSRVSDQLRSSTAVWKLCAEASTLLCVAAARAVAARSSGCKGMSAWQLCVAGLQERRAICGALSREVARMHRAAMTSQSRAQDAAAPRQWQAWDQAFAQVW